MAIFDIIGQLLLELISAKIAGGMDGKDTELINGYRTERKKLLKFQHASKFLLIWESDVELLKSKIGDGLKTINAPLDITVFQFRPIDERTIVQAAASISFYAFHFLIQWLGRNQIKTIGLVESGSTTYTTYNDPDTENLIGETDTERKFFISLKDDFSETQFLRMNEDVKTIEGYDVLSVKRGLGPGSVIGYQ